MIITADELAAFSGVTRDEGDTLPAVYIKNAGEIIANYLGYDPETAERFYDEATQKYIMPAAIKNAALRIATLLQLEEQQNIGVNSKSFGESGSRTFLNVTNYDGYLNKLSAYRSGAHVI